jgi:hypothetical protein
MIYAAGHFSAGFFNGLCKSAALTIGTLLLTCGAACSDAAFVRESSFKYPSYFLAFNFTNMNQAIEAALESCRERTPDCKVVAEFSNSCLALAHAADGKSRYFQVADKLAEAELGAKKRCEAGSGQSCTVHQTVCDRSTGENAISLWGF